MRLVVIGRESLDELVRSPRGQHTCLRSHSNRAHAEPPGLCVCVVGCLQEKLVVDGFSTIPNTDAPVPVCPSNSCSVRGRARESTAATCSCTALEIVPGPPALPCLPALTGGGPLCLWIDFQRHAVWGGAAR